MGVAIVIACCLGLSSGQASSELEMAGITITPHSISPEMRYARAPDPELGARAQLFIRNSSDHSLFINHESEIKVGGHDPQDLLGSDEWAWHDFPSAWPEHSLELPASALTVWNFNSKRTNWGVGASTHIDVRLGDTVTNLPLEIATPTAWISAATFLSVDASVYPDTLIVHLCNECDEPLTIHGCRLWLPKGNAHWRAFHPLAISDEFESWPASRIVRPHDKAIVRIKPGSLPLGYAVIEVQISGPREARRSLWSHLRVKREVFDISGGWVQGGKDAPSIMTFEPFLKTLRRMHVNTAHLADPIPGYTDQTSAGGLYERYPLKYFNALTPTERYESDEMLRRVHAVEFLGEPQYGGGRPVPPMEVWRKLAPYQATKLPTTVTHSEERIWRYYAGLSDFPHYDAYRVCAPSPDAWYKYDRWNGKKIGWGAPLETIGDMCRSLRDLNRPMPTAYWSQGPHHGWGPVWGRRRASPTPDEMRLQAYHALSSRITSLYWFNLSLPSLLKYRDTLNQLTRIGREIRLLDEFYLTGDAYRHQRLFRDGQPDWDLSSISAPSGTVLFALDLDYQPNMTSRVFEFKPPRTATLRYDLPEWCRAPVEVFRIDADGTHDVEHKLVEDGIELVDVLHKVGIYVVATSAGMRASIERDRQELLLGEEQFGFDPANNDADFETLRNFWQAIESR